MDHKLRPPRHNLNSMTQLRDKSWLTLNLRHVWESAPRVARSCPDIIGGIKPKPPLKKTKKKQNTEIYHKTPKIQKI